VAVIARRLAVPANPWQASASAAMPHYGHTAWLKLELWVFGVAVHA
jgi:hypothetical protein